MLDLSSMGPTLDFETDLWRSGHRTIAGLDEVGRGCLAGPVVAGAVILPSNDRVLCNLLRTAGVRDSKRLSAAEREALVPLIQDVALSFAIGEASAEEIDEHGIVGACRRAMWRALDALPCLPDALLLDAFPLPGFEHEQRAIVKGDDLSLSIAAASVIAKVHRDRLMEGYEGEFPGYGFASHKGYAAPKHRAALQTLGPTPLHRMSWAPLRALTIQQLTFDDCDG
jgi:ribonuclease HII